MSSVKTETLYRKGGNSLAYHAIPGKDPGIFFCSGYRSDMSGLKALALQDWCSRQGRAFTRFDYSGHGNSMGEFEKLTLSHWIEDSLDVLDKITEKQQIIVGSSMGAWIMVHLALLRPNRVKGLVGVAAAPDFTEDLMWGMADDKEKAYLKKHKIWRQLSPDGEHETVITLSLIEDGRKHLILRNKIAIDMPVRLIHGLDDRSVPWHVSKQLMEQINSDDVTLCVVKGGHHRMSQPEQIKILLRTVDELIGHRQNY